MGPIEAFWHLANLLAPGLALGAVAAGLAKLVWRRELAAVRWTRLAWPAALAAAGVALLAWAGFGADGRMATYGAMVVAGAGALWWRGFGPGR